MVAEDEEAFYYLLLAVGIAWFLFLVLVGIMTVHNYTLGKTLATMILTFIAMLVIIFVVMLLFSLIGQFPTQNRKNRRNTAQISARLLISIGFTLLTTKPAYCLFAEKQTANKKTNRIESPTLPLPRCLIS